MKLVFETDWQAVERSLELARRCKVLIKSLSIAQSCLEEDLMQAIGLPMTGSF
jgi:hypothetical protein